MIPSWLWLGGITFLMAFLTNRLNKQDIRWFNRLNRPRWLTFEKAIPVIWIFIFACLVASASKIWESDPGTTKTWLLLAFYLLVELTILAYTPGMCKLRSLKAGTIIGFAGFILGLILSLLVFPVNSGAGFLLVPFLLWSPIGTFVTWKMIPLNPGNA